MKKKLEPLFVIVNVFSELMEECPPTLLENEICNVRNAYGCWIGNNKVAHNYLLVGMLEIQNATFQ